MAEHTPTPTPWRVGGYSSLILPVNGNGAICKFESIHGMYDNHTANAAFIIKAVNAHDTLVKALQVCACSADQISAKAAREALRAVEGEGNAS